MARVRIEKLQELIKQEISKIIITDLKNPNIDKNSPTKPTVKGRPIDAIRTIRYNIANRGIFEAKPPNFLISFVPVLSYKSPTHINKAPDTIPCPIIRKTAPEIPSTFRANTPIVMIPICEIDE